MDERPVYEIRVTDHGDLIRWDLLRDGDEVARGRVLLTDGLSRNEAFFHAFENANATRLGREA